MHSELDLDKLKDFDPQVQLRLIEYYTMREKAKASMAAPPLSSSGYKSGYKTPATVASAPSRLGVWHSAMLSKNKALTVSIVLVHQLMLYSCNLVVYLSTGVPQRRH